MNNAESQRDVVLQAPGYVTYVAATPDVSYLMLFHIITFLCKYPLFQYQEFYTCLLIVQVSTLCLILTVG